MRFRRGDMQIEGLEAFAFHDLFLPARRYYPYLSPSVLILNLATSQFSNYRAARVDRHG
jgi:hypothetical protein